MNGSRCGPVTWTESGLGWVRDAHTRGATTAAVWVCLMAVCDSNWHMAVREWLDRAKNGGDLPPAAYSYDDDGDAGGTRNQPLDGVSDSATAGQCTVL